jgi:hypothetical protein
MIGKSNLHSPLAHRIQDSGQHLHTVAEQRRIGGRMNIAFYHRAIDANLPALFELLLVGVSHQNPVDLLEGRRTDALDVLGHGGFLETRVGGPDAAKRPQRDRIKQVKEQQLVAEAKHLFDDRRAQNLLSAHPIGSSILQFPAMAEVLMNPIDDGRFLIANPADAIQFAGLGVIGGQVHQRQLFFAFFAHFVVVPFFILIVKSICWTLSLYYQKKRKSTAKCIFFMQYSYLFP